jgi:actin-related protein
MGLSELLIFTANKYPRELRESMLSNILIRVGCLLTQGGGAGIDGLVSRIDFDLRANYGDELELNTRRVEDGVNGNWRSMAGLVKGREQWLDGQWITRKEFEEAGDEYLYEKQLSFNL